MENISKELLEKCETNPNEVNWVDISINQKLSEEFIEKFQEKVYWDWISAYQKLSEEFIEKFQEKVYWDYISRYQKLSEKFIEKFQEKVNWDYISSSQKISEEFIEKFQEKVNWICISKYQKLSEEFINKHKLTIPESSWMYKDKEWKRKYIQENTKYEIINDKVIAYKSCRSDGYSAFNFQYYYEVGNEYESHADYNSDNENSFGLSAWTKEKAIEYYKGKLFRVEIGLEDIACIVHDGNKIRASRLRVVNNV